MTHETVPSSLGEKRKWLTLYYFARAAVALAWVAAALTLGKNIPLVGSVLLVVYPVLDAAANFVDARRNGGLKQNLTQALNVGVSCATAVGVSIALGISMNAVLGVFGLWASLAGVLQLATGIRRWSRFGAQLAMVLSGAQSAIVGVLFLKRAMAPTVLANADITLYAAFGAGYFLVSAIWMTVSAALEPKVTADELSRARPR